MTSDPKDLPRLVFLVQVVCGEVLGLGASGKRPWPAVVAGLLFLGGVAVIGVVSSPRSLILRSLLPLCLGLGLSWPLAQALARQQASTLAVASALQETPLRTRALISGPLVQGARACRFNASPESLPDGLALDCSFASRACPSLAQGDLVLLEGLQLPIPAPKNPGEWDRRRGLARQGLVGNLRLDHPPLLLEAGKQPPGPVARLAQAIYRQPIPSAISRDTHALAVSMILGDRRLLPQEVNTWFKVSGATHLLAISGLNLAITWTVVLFLLRLVLLPLSGRWARRLPWLGAAAVVLIQTLLSGLQPSCLRACTMLLYLGLARLLEAQPRPFEALLLAVICNLALDPQALEDPGFQLSVLATGAIMLLARRYRPRGLAALLAGTLAVSLVASAATAPVSTWHFHQLPPLAFLLTLPLLLVFSPVLILVQAQVLFRLALGEAPCWLSWLADFSAQGFLAGLEATWDLGPLLLVSRARVPAVLLASLGVLAFVILSMPLRRRLALALALGLAAVGAWLAGAPGDPPQARMHLFACGQGNATLLELPGAGTILLDGGPPGCGRRVLLPFLARENLAVDTVILSHGHDDHHGGLEDLAMFLRPSRVYFPDSLPARRAIKRIWPPGSLPPGTLRPLRAGLHRGPLAQGHLDLHSPGPAPSPRLENDSSLLLFLTWRNLRLVFPGDLGWNGWRRLADRIPHDPVHFLQVPHHGSPSPVLSPVVQHLTPQNLWIFGSRGKKEGGFSGSPDVARDPRRSTFWSEEAGYCLWPLDDPRLGPQDRQETQAPGRPRCFLRGPAGPRGVGF